jgi:hypothetical protein
MLLLANTSENRPYPLKIKRFPEIQLCPLLIHVIQGDTDHPYEALNSDCFRARIEESGAALLPHFKDSP